MNFLLIIFANLSENITIYSENNLTNRSGRDSLLSILNHRVLTIWFRDKTMQY